MLLSILIPVYNERTVVERSLSLVLAAALPENMDRELVMVDDCSTDGTSDILARLAAAEPRIRLHRHAVNQGKGAAVRTAIENAQGDFCLVQDADLEYDPSEYVKLLRPLLDGHADAVFGSRYLAGEQSRVLPFWHSMINKGLTVVSNMFSNLNVTDMETCYKVFRTDLLKSIPIRSNRFGFEPEITMKASKRKLRVYEVPISYHGRTYEEGKKIGWKDGVKALGVIFHFWLVDDLYVASYGRGLLNSLTGTPQYLSWLTRVLRPHLGDTVFEAGAGLGNLTGRLMARKLEYVAGEKDPSIPARAAESIPAHAERDGLQAGPRRSGRLRTLGGKVRKRPVREPARIGGRSGGGAPAPGGNSEARRSGHRAGAARVRIIRIARRGDGPQASIFREGAAGVDRKNRTPRGPRLSVEQNRRLFLADFRQVAGPKTHQ